MMIHKPKLEITHDLEQLGAQLEDPNLVTILNLPDANRCEKRGEYVMRNGTLEQACAGCVTQHIRLGERITDEQTTDAINYFAKNHGTRWITINGRGDPFHPELKERTLQKIRDAAAQGIKSYVFTAGNNLDDEVCQTLAHYGTNVMISLYGNEFINEKFFAGAHYTTPLEQLHDLLHEARNPAQVQRFADGGHVQDQHAIAQNLRRLINAYNTTPQQSPDGTTHIAMNYVIKEQDLADNGKKLVALKNAAHAHGLAFVCNVDFQPHKNPETQQQLMALKEQHSEHSTFVNGQCQMGAGSSTTIDFNGDMYRCPYQTGGGDANFFTMNDEERERIIHNHTTQRAYNCVERKTLRKPWQTH